MLYEKGLADFNRSKLAMIISLLPKIVNPEQTAKFLEANMNDEEKLVLRVLTGPLYNVFNGNSTGHYALGEDVDVIVEYCDIMFYISYMSHSFSLSFSFSLTHTLSLSLSHTLSLSPKSLYLTVYLSTLSFSLLCFDPSYLAYQPPFSSPPPHTCTCACTDLKKVDTVRGGRVLAAMSVSEVKLCKALGINTSQRGDFLPFRNEKMG